METKKKTDDDIVVKVKKYYKDLNSNIIGAAAVNAGLITLAFKVLTDVKKDGWSVLIDIPKFFPEALTNSLITYASTFLAQQEVKALTEALSDKNKEETTVKKMGLDVKAENTNDLI